MSRRTRGREILPEWGNGPMTVSRPALLAGDSDRQFRQMIHSLVGYANSVLVVRDSFAAVLGISGSQYEILMVIYRLHANAPCTMSEVAHHVHRTLAFITIEVNKLVKHGFVEKRQDSVDRRRIFLSVTRSGIRRLEDIANIQRQLNDALFDTLTHAEFGALCRLYRKLPDSGERAVALARELVPARIPARDGKKASITKKSAKPALSQGNENGRASLS
jgi:MarR family transcriptional regulator, organic hydroperoxide resistance regulator